MTAHGRPPGEEPKPLGWLFRRCTCGLNEALASGEAGGAVHHAPGCLAAAHERPHRHLCPEADERDAMTDAEFWQHVGDRLLGPQWDEDDEGPDLDAAIAGMPCDECGSTGACATDTEGRALIHANVQEDS